MILLILSLVQLVIGQQLPPTTSTAPPRPTNFGEMSSQSPMTLSFTAQSPFQTFPTPVPFTPVPFTPFTNTPSTFGPMTAGTIAPGQMPYFNANNPEITTSKGTVRGRAISLSNGKRVFSFEGIPYAQAPTGNQRWQDAQEAMPWQQTLDATALRAMCMQQTDAADKARPKIPVREIPRATTPSPFVTSTTTTTTQFPGNAQPSQTSFNQGSTQNPYLLSNDANRVANFGAFPIRGGTTGTQPQFTFNPIPGDIYRQNDQASVLNHYNVGNMSEDCLYLNVYTPNIALNSRLPVMVMIHGGSFTSGTAGDYDANGIATNIANRDVVVVTINYRLGIFGFLVTSDGRARGNYGITDQILALRWVQREITNFGGDPNAVTLYGFSAGAISASLLTIEPQAQGLFRSLILSSGTAFMPAISDARGETSINTGAQLAEILGCAPSNVFNCLSEKSAQELLYNEPVGGMMDLWRPVFLQKEYRLSQRRALPTMLGVTETEAGFLYTADSQNPAYYSFNRDTIDMVTRGLLDAIYPGTQSDIIRQMVTSVYADKAEGIADNNSRYWLNRALEEVSDAMYNGPIYRDAASVASSDQRAYLYLFDHLSPNDRCSMFWRGATHGDDQLYLLGPNSKHRQFIMTANDQWVSDQWAKMVTNFVKTGNPSSDGQNQTMFAFNQQNMWEPVLVSSNGRPSANYYQITPNPTMMDNFNERARNLWTNIVPQMVSLTSPGGIGDGVPIVQSTTTTTTLQPNTIPTIATTG